jgi:hypothetical protein
MKKLGFILLMMLLPLQSAWTAAHLYHSHDSSDALVEAVFHDHFESGHGHAHTHGEHAHEQGKSPDQSDGDESGATDHHHFHVHTISVLGDLNVPDFPSPSAVQHSRNPAWQETLFSQRIERPNWR